MYRILDANINRVCEGLRVIEDYLRFELNDKNCFKIKEIRHFLRENLGNLIKLKALQERDSANDIGSETDNLETNRINKTDILKANILRVEEGLRVIEEYLKIDETLKKNLKDIKSFRFYIYQIEKEVFLKKNLTLKLYLKLEIEINEIKKILEEINILYEKYKFTEIEIGSKKISENELYLLCIKIKEHCLQKGVNLLLKNNLIIAKEVDSDGLTVDEKSLPLEILRKNFNRNIGLTITSLKRIDYNQIKEYDFVITDDYEKTYQESLSILVPDKIINDNLKKVDAFNYKFYSK